MQNRLFPSTFIALFVLLFGSPADLLAQESENNWRSDRVTIDRRYAEELQEVSLWCRSEGMIKQAEQTLALYKKRDPHRQYIFLPTEEDGLNSTTATVKTTDAKILEWSKRLKEARANHAQTVFKMAKVAAEDNAGAIAFQMLHEAVYFDPELSEVRSILGHKRTKKGWQVGPDRIRAKKAPKRHKVMDWQGKEYLQVSSSHFNIASTASEEETIELARNLERWHDIWRQVCFEYWSSSKQVARWIEGRGKAKIPSRKFDVVFFKDRDDYVGQLKNSIRGISNSTGYYSDVNRTSFFYASDNKQDRTTWRHELTHQLYQESVRSKNSPFEDEFLWLVEGAAMYFESVVDHGSYATVGGFEGRRSQFARIRLFRERFYMPVSELSALSQAEFQSHKNIKRLYSQSAGLAHMLMDDQEGKYQARYFNFMKLLYAGKLKPGTFEKVIGLSYDEMDKQYQTFLRVSSEEVADFLSEPESRTELALPGAKLTDSAFESLGRCKNLTWLDLSANQISGPQMNQLGGMNRLSQLFLTNCVLDQGCFAGLTKLDSVTEIDLRGTNTTDAFMSELHSSDGFKLGNLNILRLSNTQVSDTTLLYLRGQTNLRTLDVRGTSVTQGGVNRLKSDLPDLEILN